jgi:hypothetical protein
MLKKYCVCVCVCVCVGGGVMMHVLKNENCLYTNTVKLIAHKQGYTNTHYCVLCGKVLTGHCTVVCKVLKLIS